MTSLEIHKYMLQLRHSKRHELNDIIKEIVSLGEFPKELELEVVDLLKNDRYILSNLLCDIMILTGSCDIYNLAIKKNILSDLDYAKLLGSGIHVDKVEGILEDILFKIYRENYNLRRSVIIENMAKGGTERSLNLIDVILDDLTTILPVEKIKYSASYTDNKEKDVETILNGMELNSLSEFVEKLKNVKQKILDRINKSNNDSDLIESDKNETKKYENKSSFLYCYRTQKQESYVIESSLKSIVAFLNTYGGELFIGIKDDGTILGLENDFKLCGKGNDQDAFRLKMDSLITQQIGAGNLANYIDISFVKQDGKEIAKVTITKSESPVWLKNKGKEKFFVRRLGSTTEIKGQEMSQYISDHWD